MTLHAFFMSHLKKKKSDFNLCRSKSGFKLSRLKKKDILKNTFHIAPAPR